MPEKQKKKSYLSFKDVLKNYGLVIFNRKFIYFTFPFCLLFAGMMCWDTFSPFYIIKFLGLGIFYFGLIQTIVYGGFITGTHLIRLFIKKLNPIMRYGLMSALLFSICAGFTLALIPQRGSIVLFFLTAFTLSTGLVFYTLHRKAIESVDSLMGIKM